MAVHHPDFPSAARAGSLEGSHVIFVVTFLAFLLVAMVSLLIGLNWRALLPGAEGDQTVLGGIRSAVYTVMSQIV